MSNVVSYGCSDLWGISRFCDCPESRIIPVFWFWLTRQYEALRVVCLTTYSSCIPRPNTSLSRNSRIYQSTILFNSEMSIGGFCDPKTLKCLVGQLYFSRLSLVFPAGLDLPCLLPMSPIGRKKVLARPLTADFCRYIFFLPLLNAEKKWLHSHPDRTLHNFRTAKY